MQQNVGTATPGSIQILPELLINQIAAGEVVERPASIVKELVENSLDAGASRIEVRLWDGGLTKIQILDNGSGMSQADLALCLTRHATSKITSAQDLEGISTFGFRGEALASIAAVSRIEIRSRPPESQVGHSVEADFGLLLAPPKPVGCPGGTSITVEELFSRLPARLKFMRSHGTESSHCSRVLKEIAAGNSETQFFLTNQDRKVLEFVSSTRANRFAECFRPAWEPMRVYEQNDEAELEAFLLPPHVIQDRGEIWFYINRRPVRNRGLLAAVRQAYLSTLGPHHEPSGAVFLDIRTDWVDVNVHPQKTEVRCYRQESLFPWIVAAVKKAIGAQRTMYSIAPGTPSAGYSSRPTQPPLESVERELALEPASSTVSAYPHFVAEQTPLLPWHGSERDTAVVSAGLPTSTNTGAIPPFSPSPSLVRNTVAASTWENGSPTAGLKYLGQIKASYLVCESESGLVLVDQHALHEKVRTEELKKRFSAGNLAVQTYLIPKVLSLPSDLLPVLEEHAEVLSKFGFEVALFGNNEAVLRSRPELIDEKEAPEVLQQVLREIASERLKPQDILNQSLHLLLATMACHSAIRANHLLSPIEAQSLLNRLDRLELGWTCPHGRPILFELSYQQIEHHFERA